jgi:hypothetical protein
MEHKNKIQNWLHYWTIAQSRPDLKEFKDYLQINANMPHVDVGENKIMTKDGVKTFNQLVKELAPHWTNDDGKLN